MPRPRIFSQPIGIRLPLEDFELFEKTRKEKGLSATDWLRQMIHENLVSSEA